MRARIRDWGRGASALKILRAAYNIASSRSSVGPDRNEDSYMPFKGMSQANVDGGWLSEILDKIWEIFNQEFDYVTIIFFQRIERN